LSKFPPVFAAVALATVALLATAGCATSGSRLIASFHTSSAVVTPSGAVGNLPISVAYTLTRPATITAYLVGASGEKFYLEKDELRPVAGEYTLTFDGAYAPNPDTDERRVLSAGTYKLTVEARDTKGSDEASAQLQVQNPDTVPPSVENLTVYPETFAPKGEGLSDTLTATFRTTKLATVSLYLVSDSGKRFVLERQEREQPGEHSTTWDGQIGNQLLPGGNYRFVVEAQDAAANVSLSEKPLKLDATSMPDAHILSVNFEPNAVMYGGLVKVTIRVKNMGNTVLKTQGPDPGYVYNSQEGFSTIEGGSFRDKKGYWRVGVDWAGAPGSAGAKYPYRWGFGKDLQPGEEATVVGYIRMNEKYPRIWLYAGLVQEQIRYWDNQVGQTTIDIGY
jgi:hypothetical protein